MFSSTKSIKAGFPHYFKSLDSEAVLSAASHLSKYKCFYSGLYVLKQYTECRESRIAINIGLSL